MNRRLDGQLVTKQPTLDTSAYASGDVLFAPVELVDFVRDTKGLSVLRTLTVIDLANQKQAIDLLFFSRDPGSIGALNAALDVSTAQMAYFLGRVTILAADYVTLKSATNAEVTKLLEMLIPTEQLRRSVWVAGVCRSGTPTYAATSLIFKFVSERW